MRFFFSSFYPNSPVSSLSSRKNFWLKIKATPLISSTLASAVVFLFTKLAVMAMANFPRNSLRAKPVQWGGWVAGNGMETWKCRWKSVKWYSMFKGTLLAFWIWNNLSWSTKLLMLLKLVQQYKWIHDKYANNKF